MTLKNDVSDTGTSTLTNADLNKWKIDSDRNFGGIEMRNLFLLHHTVEEIIYTVLSFNDINRVSEAQLRQAKQVCNELSQSYSKETLRLEAFVNSVQIFSPMVS